MTRLVRAAYQGFDPDLAGRELRELVTFDRYQASAGAEGAAVYVAERAVAAGLDDVEVHRYPADGQRRWWTFAAPMSWTPERAELTLLGVDGRPDEPVVSYPEQPYRLAFQSAPTADQGVVTPLVLWSRWSGGPLPGCTVVVDTPGLPLVAVAEAGAIGVVVGGGPSDDDLARRLELPNGSTLFGFSVSPSQLRRIIAAAAAGGSARVTVSVRRGAGLPVVTGRLPGSGPGGVLLCAHLCHPAPSANDNASGVVALLAVARAAAARRSQLRRGLWFVWGPEFVGLAAHLHEHRADPARTGFDLAINLDMVGEDQRVCGGPLIVERSPDHLPSYLNAVVERCVESLPPTGRSFSSAVACDTWSWRATPFVGASDHLLPADRSIGRPSVQLGHWPDRYHHTSADTLDKVDRAELRRVVAVTSGALATICEAGAADLPEIERLTTAWGAELIRSCLQPPAGAREAGPGDFDPWCDDARADLLEHRRRVAVASVGSLSSLDGGSGDDRRRTAERWLDGLADHLHVIVAGETVAGEAVAGEAVAGEAVAGEAVAGEPAVVDRGPSLIPGWPGPFNLRALIEDASEADRAWLSEQLALDGPGAYATFVALAHSLDGHRGAGAAIRWAAFASQLPISVPLATRLFAVLRDTGWLAGDPAPVGAEP
ncbi:hypothetical protein DMB66_41865 [Actinoplanes sp. ATCC 53533]|nr:hypothetical protein DMB66_41865 [Actinoplanes sp. ATCC 53533]